MLIIKIFFVFNVIDGHYLDLIFKVVHQQAYFIMIHLFSMFMFVLQDDDGYLDLMFLEDPQLSRLIPSIMITLNRSPVLSAH
jgi:hypothetical protein